MPESINVDADTIAEFCLDPRLPIAKRAGNFTRFIAEMPVDWELLFATNFAKVDLGGQKIEASHEVLKMSLLLAMVVKDLIDEGAALCVPGNPEDE